VRPNLISTRQSLANLLPPKKADLEPRPAIVDDAEFEVADPTEVRLFPLIYDPSPLTHPLQFGDGGEDAWEDDEEDGFDDDEGQDCRTQ
jgi:DnaJ family protein A protein 2